ncbi:MAG: DegT/DnrJ/EryC1/StrS family aminotransferase [Planctomycetaceae bacterium]
MRETTRVDDLAIFGGPPAFAEPLHVGRPNVGDRARLMDRLGEMLDRGWLTNDGPFVRAFEWRVAELLGVRHCVAMSSGTVALEIAIRALGMAGEVIVPSFTFVATAHALQWQEITPVFCDIEPATHTLDPRRVEPMISDRTTGIIGVHLWGRPCDVHALREIADRRNLRLLFDASHAFGCSYRGQMLGRFGDAEVLSFHATKFINTFEGGAVLTGDDELAEKMRLMRNFGFAGYDRVIYLGTNGKMNEAAAAMGLTSLESFEEFVETNRRNYRRYQQEIESIPGLTLMPVDPAERHNYQYVVVEADPAQTRLSRDQLVDILWAENVRARRYFFPGCHRMEPYRSLYPDAGLTLPVTERVADRVLLLPTGTAIGEREVTTIGSLLKTAIENADRIAEHFAARQG